MKPPVDSILIFASIIAVPICIMASLILPTWKKLYAVFAGIALTLLIVTRAQNTSFIIAAGLLTAIVLFESNRPRKTNKPTD